MFTTISYSTPTFYWLIKDRPRLKRPPELFTHHSRNIKHEALISYLFLSPLFYPLKKADYWQRIQILTEETISALLDRKLIIADFLRYLQPIKIINQSLYATILHGLHTFIDGNYLGSVYILGPQTEELLRLLTVQQGLSNLEISRQGTIHRPLGRTLLSLKSTLPSGIYDYSHWILKDQTGLNIRNKVAHGLISQSTARPYLSVALIHLILLLTACLKAEKTRLDESS